MLPWQVDVTMPMPTGRIEKRIAKTVILEICLYDEPGLKERTITENVSPRGARVFLSGNGGRSSKCWLSLQMRVCGREDRSFTASAWLRVGLLSGCNCQSGGNDERGLACC